MILICMYVCMYVFIKLHITTQSGPVILVILCHSHVCMYVCTYVCMYVCTYVCMCVFFVFFPSILDIKFVGRTSRGVTQEGLAGFLIKHLSAVRALVFLARRIQPFLSLVDREVEFCVLTI